MGRIWTYIYHILVWSMAYIENKKFGGGVANSASGLGPPLEIGNIRNVNESRVNF